MSVSAFQTDATTTAESMDCNGAILLLENGDRLTRDEFMRRYEAMPALKKAELIEGVVFLASPVRQEYHGEPHLSLGCWLGVYRAMTPGLAAGDNSTVLLDINSTTQPDCLLFIRADHGGLTQIDQGGFIVGAPDLVAEVAASSASYDLHDKLLIYERSGVREYIVWRVLDRQIDWFVLREGRYEKLSPAADGTFRSTIFPGLWLAPDALIRGDLKAVLDVALDGLRSPEHAEFVAQLERTGGPHHS